VNVNRQVEAAAFGDQITEDEVLEGAIFLLGRDSSDDISLVNVFGLGA
jgi:hypothetical protein